MGHDAYVNVGPSATVRSSKSARRPCAVLDSGTECALSAGGRLDRRPADRPARHHTHNKGRDSCMANGRLQCRCAYSLPHVVRVSCAPLTQPAATQPRAHAIYPRRSLQRAILGTRTEKRSRRSVLADSLNVHSNGLTRASAARAQPLTASPVHSSSKQPLSLHLSCTVPCTQAHPPVSLSNQAVPLPTPHLPSLPPSLQRDCCCCY